MDNMKNEVRTDDLVEGSDSELEVRHLPTRRSKVLKDWRNDDGRKY